MYKNQEAFLIPNDYPDLTRWVFPESPQELAVAEKVDMFFNEHFRSQKMDLPKGYRLVIPLAFQPPDTESFEFFGILHTAFFSGDPISNFFSLIGDHFLSRASSAEAQILSQVQAAVPTTKETKEFLIDYVQDILLLQIPYRAVLQQRLLAEISLMDIQSLSLPLSDYDEMRDPRICLSKQKTWAGLCLQKYTVESPLPIICASISIADTLLFVADQEVGNAAKFISLPANSVLLTPMGPTKKYLLSAQVDIPISHIAKLTIGADD